MKHVEPLPDGQWVSIAESGYFTVFAPDAEGRGQVDWRGDFGDIEPNILCVVDGSITVEGDDDTRIVEYDSPEWAARVKDHIARVEAVAAAIDGRFTRSTALMAAQGAIRNAPVLGNLDGTA